MEGLLFSFLSITSDRENNLLPGLFSSFVHYLVIPTLFLFKISRWKFSKFLNTWVFKHQSTFPSQPVLSSLYSLLNFTFIFIGCLLLFSLTVRKSSGIKTLLVRFDIKKYLKLGKYHGFPWNRPAFNAYRMLEIVFFTLGRWQVPPHLHKTQQLRQFYDAVGQNDVLVVKFGVSVRNRQIMYVGNLT